MLTDVLDALACPQCAGALTRADGMLRCDAGHSFDVARQGYVNLLPGRANSSTADTPAMIAARKAFLDGGHFAPITDAVVSAAATAVPEDAEGIYPRRGSGHGVRAVGAARCGSRSVRASLWTSPSTRPRSPLTRTNASARSSPTSGRRLPLQDGCAALVLDIFSPRNAEEFARVLIDGGTLIVVTPNPEHLAELVGPLELITIDPRKRERLSVKLGSHFEQVAEQIVTYPLALNHADATAAAAMGPSAAHVSAEELSSRVEALDDPVAVTVSVTVGTYRASARAAAQT